MKKLYLCGWLKSRLPACIATLSIYLSATIIFLLYGVLAEPLYYTMALTAVALLILATVDYLRFLKKIKTLEELKKQILYTTENLPTPNTPIEESYQELVRLLFKQNTDSQVKADSEFTAMVDYYTMWVHQIKTPISAMRLLIQSENGEHRAELEAELFKIEQYVEMVLQYLRLDSASTDLVFKRCSLDEIIRQAVRKYAKIFILKKITLVYEGTDATVLTDEKWLTFVLEQLLSNALKYTNRGKISIYMAENQTLVIEDTGIGIAAEDLPRVFEKGYTGYNGRTNKKSTGIGLYLCKRILTMLSHSIQIESNPGTGTKVKIGLASDRLEAE